MAVSSRATGFGSGAISGATTGASVGGAWGAVIGGVIGGVSGILSGGGEKDAMKMAEDQAREIEKASRENTRRSTLDLKNKLGMIRATVGASNLQFSGSAKKYSNVFESTFRNEMAWDKHRAEVEAKTVRKGGKAAARSIQSMGLTGMLNTIGAAASNDAFGTYTKAGGYESPFAT